MGNLLNKSRPPVFCPGCSHDRITQTLDRAFMNMGLKGEEIVIVTDIGCSGLFDTFFNTHAFHGLHGRALTYATGLKMAQPDLHVIVTMGDGGLGIGGAHVLSACRRNLDLTLLILNNFNFGMTGGQFSATTPSTAQVGSGFLNRLELPFDVCKVAASAGAAYARRCSGFAKNLSEEIENAVRFDGFSILDIWGICPGRYTKRNRLTPRVIEESLAKMPPIKSPVPENQREEYGRHYRNLASEQKQVSQPKKMAARFDPIERKRMDVVILGSAGQRIITAGEILCLAGLTAGFQTTQKNEYNITVLRGHSITEVVLSPQAIGYTGIERPDVILSLSQEGVDRRQRLFDSLDNSALILQVPGVSIPSCKGEILQVNFKSQKIKSTDWALAAIIVLARMNRVIHLEMLKSALKYKFRNNILESSLDLVKRVRVHP
jgi:2-oxoglutarate ferredoxin oxidoreductase subunit beta